MSEIHINITRRSRLGLYGDGPAHSCAARQPVVRRLALQRIGFIFAHRAQVGRAVQHLDGTRAADARAAAVARDPRPERVDLCRRRARGGRGKAKEGGKMRGGNDRLAQGGSGVLGDVAAAGGGESMAAGGGMSILAHALTDTVCLQLFSQIAQRGARDDRLAVNLDNRGRLLASPPNHHAESPLSALYSR